MSEFSCCVPMCHSTEDENTSLYPFPTDSQLKNMWFSAMSFYKEIQNSKWQFVPESRICEKHFEEECFSVSAHSKQLLPYCFPTIFNDFKISKSIQNRLWITLSRERYKRNLKDQTTMNKIAGDNNSNVKEIGIQVDTLGLIRQVHKVNKQKQSLNEKGSFQQSIKSNDQKIRQLKLKIKHLQNMLELKQEGTVPKCLNLLADAVKNKDIKALFLKDQLCAFSGNKIQYSKSVLHLCNNWFNTAPKDYEFVQSLEILHLPSTKTLINYAKEMNVDNSQIKNKEGEDYLAYCSMQENNVLEVSQTNNTIFLESEDEMLEMTDASSMLLQVNDESCMILETHGDQLFKT